MTINSSITSPWINGERINGIKVIKNEEVDNILQNLPREGTFIKGLVNKKGEQSYVLQVSEDYQSNLFDYLLKNAKEGENLQKGSVANFCSHISVIRPTIGDLDIPEADMQKELGQTYSFEPLYLGKVTPDHDNQWKRIWLVVVKAKVLEEIRIDHGMGPKMGFGGKEHEFHISIANRPRQKTEI